MLKKISADQLAVGMYLHKLQGHWIDHPFWRNHFLLDNPDDISLIQRSGIVELWIDTEKGRDVINGGKAETPAAITPQAMLVDAAGDTPVAEELERAAKICDQGKIAVMTMLQEARMGKAIDVDSVGSLVEQISQSVFRNPGALISLARLKTADDYTYMHSVAVCALMIALGQQLKLSEEDIHEAGMAGLLHDIGKALMPSEIINKKGSLTDAEFSVIRTHPQQGYELLQHSPDVSAIALDVALHHHEKIDGSGYPHGLVGDNISLFARMAAVCDVYDAITSNRPYKEGWDPAESIRKMSEWSKGHFDESIFNAFVKSIGIYPIGSLVRMRSDRLAIVIEQSRSSLLTPQVKAFFSITSNSRIPPEVLNLSSPAANDKILSIESPAQWNLGDLSSYWIGS